MTDINPDDVSRIIMLLYGRMDHGGPFWCYVAIKPSQFDAFREAERGGDINLYDFDAFGEVIVSAEGDQPPDDVTSKVAEIYGADASTFFSPIDPLAEINKQIEAMDAVPNYPLAGSTESDEPPASGWAARVGRKGVR